MGGIWSPRFASTCPLGGKGNWNQNTKLTFIWDTSILNDKSQNDNDIGHKGSQNALMKRLICFGPHSHQILRYCPDSTLHQHHQYLLKNCDHTDLWSYIQSQCQGAPKMLWRQNQQNIKIKLSVCICVSANITLKLGFSRIINWQQYFQNYKNVYLKSTLINIYSATALYSSVLPYK